MVYVPVILSSSLIRQIYKLLEFWGKGGQEDMPLLILERESNGFAYFLPELKSYDLLMNEYIIFFY